MPFAKFRLSRHLLLLGPSLLALGAGLAMPQAASAGITVSSPQSGYIWTSTAGDDLTVDSTGALHGDAGDGLHIVSTGKLGALSNAGTIDGGLAILNEGAIAVVGNTGIIAGKGDGVQNRSDIGSLSNSGTLTGSGDGNGILNTGAIGNLSNTGRISYTGAPVANFWGIGNSGTVGQLNNSGTIAGATAIANYYGIITNLTNSGTLTGTTGVVNGVSSEITTLDNRDTITATTDAVSNGGIMGSLSNSGTISGGTHAIRNTSTGTLGPITNSGTISGVIENDSSADLTINGGTGNTFGVLTGGSILNMNSNLIFGTGNIRLDELALLGSHYLIVPNGDTLATLDITQNGGIVSSGSLSNLGTINTLGNAGAITGGNVGLLNYSRIDTLTNTGTISDTNGYSGISNTPGATVGVLLNKGRISGAQEGIANYPTSTLSTLTNTGVISGGINGLLNSGNVTALTSDGTISGGTNAVLNYGHIVNLGNSGMLSGGGAGHGISNYGSIDSLSNSGTISYTGTINQTVNGFSGIGNFGTVGVLTNTGFVQGAIGIDNSGTITTLSNENTISGIVLGIRNRQGDVITTLDNTGAISGGATALNTAGTIGTLTNSGSLIGSGAGNGVLNTGAITSFSNSGTIGYTGTINQTANGFWAIGNGGTIGVLNNSGTVTGAVGVYNNQGTITTLINSKTITGVTAGIRNNSGATITTVTNSGAISGGLNGLNNLGAIYTLTNGGTILGDGAGNGIQNVGTIANLSNSGTIGYTGTITNAFLGIGNLGSITSLTNSGIVTGGTGIGNTAGKTLTTLTNSGTITGLVDGLYNAGNLGGVNNSGTITGVTHAILNTGTGTLGPITNSGTISGIIENDSSQDLTINGGPDTGGIGTVFGLLTGGSIVNQNSKLVFGTGNIRLDELALVGGQSVTVSGGDTLAALEITRDGGIVSTGTASGALTNDGTVTSLSNAGTITGGAAGILNTGSLVTLSNSGTISGLNGIVNLGTIGSISNAGTISSSTYAIHSVASSLGPITNTGVIAGDIADGTQTLTIVGGSGDVFGTLTGYNRVGFIFAGDVNLSRNTLLNDAIDNQGHVVTNTGTVKVGTSPATTLFISGSYAQTQGGLVFLVSGTSGVNSALNVGDSATITGTTITIAGTGLTSGEQFTVVMPAQGTYSDNTYLVSGTNWLSASGSKVGQDLVITLFHSPVPEADSSGIGLASAAFGLAPMSVMRAIDAHSLTFDEAGLSEVAGRDGVAWGEILGGFGQRNTGVAFTFRDSGLVTGWDWKVADGLSLGTAISYMRVRSAGRGDAAHSVADIDAYGMTAYGRYVRGNAFVSAQLNAGVSTFDQYRAVVSAGDVARSSYEGRYHLGTIGAGYDLHLSKTIVLTPLASLTYLQLASNAFDESGSVADLHVARGGTHTLSQELGMRVSLQSPAVSGGLNTNVTLSWLHTYNRGATSIVGEEIPTAEVLNVQQARVGADGVKLDLATTLKRTGKMSIRIRYDGEFRRGFQNHSGQLEASWQF